VPLQARQGTCPVRMVWMGAKDTGAADVSLELVSWMDMDWWSCFTALFNSREV